MILSNSSIVVAASDQISSDLAGEIVMLNLKNGSYYGLDGVGARVWNLIQSPQPVAAVCDVIQSEYAVDPDRCASDLLVLLGELAAADLIEVRDVGESREPARGYPAES